MKPEEAARKAIEQGLEIIRRHPVRTIFGADGSGPGFDMPAERIEACNEVQRIARMFPAVWATFPERDRREADPRHPYAQVVNGPLPAEVAAQNATA